MDLSTLLIRDSEDRLDSLTLALQALSRWTGGNVRYRSLNAALGVSFMTTAVRRKSCLGWWMTHACDAFLEEAAAMFCIRVRPVHPAEAAVGLAECTEFDQHFQASYAPLIRRALEHDQPVLAWQGWPDFRSSLWGLITRRVEEGVGFGGTTMWSGDALVPLVRPPVQLYTVEEALSCAPRDENLFRLGIERARTIVYNGLSIDADVVTGPQAYDVWADRLQHADVCLTCDGRSGHCHRQHARFITSNRQAAIRFLQHYRDGAHREVHTLIDALLAHCRGVVDSLALARDEAMVNRLIATPEGRQALTAGVRAAQGFEQAMANAIDQLADRLT